MISKGEIFILTFLAYTSIHALRTSYSESKGVIQKDLEIDSKLMGILDSLMLTFLGIGHFLHAIKPMKRPVRNLWIAMLLCGANFIALPILIDGGIFHSYAYLVIFMVFNGFLQSYTWPTLLMVINSRFCSKKNSTILGFWSTNTNFGNIIGYFVFQVIKFDWKLSLIIISLYTIMNALLICLRISELPKKQVKLQAAGQSSKSENKGGSCLTAENHNSLTQNLTENQPKSEQSTQQQQQEQSRPEKASAPSTLSALRNPKIVLITISFALAKSIIYGIMLWLPLYFQTDNGLKEYASLIPITYDIWAIFGSIFIGYLFIKIINKGLLMIPFMLALVISFFFLRFFALGVTTIFFVIGIVGFCLGGIFNTLAGLVVIQLTSILPEQLKSSSLGFYSALTMAIANISTAATQLLIGFVIGKQHQQGIFLVFLIYSAVCLICLIMISIISRGASRKGKGGQISVQGSLQADIKGQISAKVQDHPAASLDAHCQFKNRLQIEDKIGGIEYRKPSVSSSSDQNYFERQCDGQHIWKSGYERNVYDHTI